MDHTIVDVKSNRGRRAEILPIWTALTGRLSRLLFFIITSAIRRPRVCSLLYDALPLSLFFSFFLSLLLIALLEKYDGATRSRPGGQCARSRGA
jgi:hypothetical protein